MNPAIAFIVVVIIWSTTPLGIVLSTLGSSPYFAVSARMLIGLVLCSLLFLAKRQKITLSPIALKNYLYAGLGVFVTMSLVYVSAQSISSGIISVVFGLTPIVTGIFAYILLQEAFFKLHKILGLLLGLSGLGLVFYPNFSTEGSGVMGLFLVTIGMVFQAFISVKLKKINAPVKALETTLGALLVSVPLFLLSTLWLEDGAVQITTQAALAIGYLALFGSVIGFSAYYYLIKHANVRVVGIVPLITPVFALLLGNFFNNETLVGAQLLGIVIVLLGLGYYEYGDKTTWRKESLNH